MLTTARLTLAALLCTLGCYLVVRQPAPRSDPTAWASHWLWTCLLFGACAAVAFLGRIGNRRTAAIIIIAGTVCCQLAAFRVPPVTSTDAYHYVWDGRVQLSGTSPYRYVPGDDALAKLRDPILFPGLRPDQHSHITTVWPLTPDEAAQRWRNRRWTVLSRPAVPTIYPPAAQAYFAAIAAVTPWSAGTTGVQVVAALLAIAIVVLLLWLMKRLGIDPRWAILWGWSPTVAVEASANGHVDVLAAGFVLGACAVSALGHGTKRGVWTGVLLALAILTKIFPVVLAPTFISLRPRTRDLRGALVVAGATIVTIVAFYLPHYLAVGSRVIGYLPGYFADQGYQDTGRGIRRFGVLGTIGVPEQALYPAAALIVVCTVLAVWWFADPRQPWRSGVWLLGTAFLLATPSYAWYMLVLVPLICLARRPEWMAVPIAAGTGYVLYPNLDASRLVWTLAAGVVVSVNLARLAFVLINRRTPGSDPADLVTSPA